VLGPGGHQIKCEKTLTYWRNTVSAKIVAYDLRGKNPDYNAIIEKIEAYPKSVRVTESCWIIETSEKCSRVRDDLWEVMTSRDRLFVGRLNGSAWRNTECGSEALNEVL
jgi:hypothetical protein